MARLGLARLGVALLRRLRFAFGGGERLGQFGDGLSARRALRLLETRRAERAALALDSGVFRFEAREAAPFLSGGVKQRPATGGEVRRRGLRLGERRSRRWRGGAGRSPPLRAPAPRPRPLARPAARARRPRPRACP